MGMERVVSFAEGAVPSWPSIAETLVRRGLAVQMRMIDNELAFPDEQPRENWRELRIGTTHGMITIRREGEQLRVIVWGNATADLQDDWQKLTAAVAGAGKGQVV
jgi:hypothetical protein